MKISFATISEQINTAGAETGAQTNASNAVSTALNVVFGIVGIIAVVMIILGGVNYTTSQGDPSKIQKAKNTITYGIIGLVVSLLAFAIINFVLKIF